jgi:hypothetical protein
LLLDSRPWRQARRPCPAPKRTIQRAAANPEVFLPQLRSVVWSSLSGSVPSIVLFLWIRELGLYFYKLYIILAAGFSRLLLFLRSLYCTYPLSFSQKDCTSLARIGSSVTDQTACSLKTCRLHDSDSTLLPLPSDQARSCKYLSIANNPLQLTHCTVT